MEESATDEAVGMQQGYAQIRSLVNRHQGRWVRFAKDDSLCGVQDETPRFKAERLNLNIKCCKVLPALPARAKMGEWDGITACFAMSKLIMQQE